MYFATKKNIFLIWSLRVVLKDPVLSQAPKPQSPKDCSWREPLRLLAFPLSEECVVWVWRPLAHSESQKKIQTKHTRERCFSPMLSLTVGAAVDLAGMKRERSLGLNSLEEKDTARGWGSGVAQPDILPVSSMAAEGRPPDATSSFSFWHKGFCCCLVCLLLFY